jgi:hypothetical protein
VADRRFPESGDSCVNVAFTWETPNPYVARERLAFTLLNCNQNPISLIHRPGTHTAAAHEHIMSAEGSPPQEAEEGPAQPQGLPINIQGPNGQQPTPEQIRQIQQQLTAEAAKLGISVQEYVQKLREQAMAQQQAQMRAQMEAQQQQQQQQQQQPIQPGPPKPEAIAVANWLKTQELKPRTVVHDEKRKDMFRGETGCA